MLLYCGFGVRNWTVPFYPKIPLHKPLPSLSTSILTAPPSSQNSFYLFGVCDELGVLREGEVYINVAGDVKLGTVLVGRNPAYSTSGELSERVDSVAFRLSNEWQY